MLIMFNVDCRRVASCRPTKLSALSSYMYCSMSSLFDVSERNPSARQSQLPFRIEGITLQMISMKHCS